MEEDCGLPRRSHKVASFFVCNALVAILTLAGLLTTAQSALDLNYVVSLPFHGGSRIGRVSLLMKGSFARHELALEKSSELNKKWK